MRRSLRRLLPEQMLRLAEAQHGARDQWRAPWLVERHAEVPLIGRHGYPDDTDPKYDMGVDGMAVAATEPDAAGRRSVLGGFLMGTATTPAGEIQQEGKVLASRTEDVSVLPPRALLALRRIAGEMEAAYARLGA